MTPQTFPNPKKTITSHHTAEATLCNKESVSAIESLTVDLAKHFADLKTSPYEQRPATAVKLLADTRSQGLLLLLPTCVILLQVVANAFAVFGPRLLPLRRAQRAGAALLLLGLSGLFFGAFAFPAFLVFTYALVYPFYEVAMADGFTYALLLSMGAVLVPMVGLFEGVVEMGYVETVGTDAAGKGEDSAGGSGE